MSERSILMCGFVYLLVLSTFMGSASGAIDRESVQGAWLFDEGEGSEVLDSSGKGHHGSFTADDIARVDGVFGGALEFFGGGEVVVPHDDAFTTPTFTLMAWVKVHEIPTSWSMRLVAKDGWPDRNYGMYVAPTSGVVHFAFCAPGQTDVGNTNGNTPIADDEWHHVAMTYDLEMRQIYVDGELDHEAGSTIVPSENTVDVQIGTGPVGLMDEVLIATEALLEEDIKNAMQVGLKKALGIVAAVATQPNPADGATDVYPGSILSWTASDYAVTHDVYLGTVWEDVNDASVADPRGVLVSQGQEGLTFDPGRLALEETYYWRVDEVNGPPDNTVYKGEAWSFTVEPLAYEIENVVATSNGSSDADAGPENTVNGSGLNANDEHSIDAPDMWLASPGADPLWIQYEFDRLHKLHEMLVWNYNVQFELMLGFGLKGVTVEHSADGVDWTVLGDVELAQATARSDYTANTAVDLAGVTARFVRLTVTSGYGPMGQFGLSEVRFLYVPTLAREPEPADGETEVAVDITLGWRPGREAAVHDVYLGTVPDAPALVDTVSVNDYAPADLEFGTTYHWKIDEVNEAEVPSVWGSDVWSFSTREYVAIDDMERYDDEENRIFDTWVDGFVNDTGATVGYFEAPFAERSVVNSGRQSMPLEYDNSAGPFYSEAELDLGGVDLDTHGADTLRLFVAGRVPAFLEAADGTILMNGIGTDIWGVADEFRYAYKSLTGNGSMVVRVDDLDGTPSGWVKAGVMVRQSIDAGSAHTMMIMTGGDGNGASWQGRLTNNASSENEDATDAVAPPYWVKVERAGNDFSGYVSADGQTWTQIGAARTVSMNDPVLIGLALTSHNAGRATGAQFSNVSTTGNVTGDWQIAEIGVAQPAGNDLEALYVALEDSAGKVAVVTNPDAAALGRSRWTEWLIPYSELSGINFNDVRTLFIGVGDRDNPTAGGTGLIFVDDIGYGKPARVE